MTGSSQQEVSVSFPRVTLLMIVCGLMSAASIGAVSAATTADGSPSVAVKFRPESLSTEAGTRAVYRRLQQAARDVCPNPSSASPFVPAAVQECRNQSIARAVHKIDSPRLAAMVAGGANSG